MKKYSDLTPREMDIVDEARKQTRKEILKCGLAVAAGLLIGGVINALSSKSSTDEESVIETEGEES